MAKYARKHHYISAGYLAGFAVPEARDCVFYVFDLNTRRIRQATPESEAWAYDYHRIDKSGIAPDYFDKILAQFEGAVPAAIKALDKNPMCSEDDFAVLLGFIALTAVRTPFFRDGFTRQTELELQLPFEEAVGKAEHWTNLEQWLSKVDTDWTHEDTIRLQTDQTHAKVRVQASYFFHMLMHWSTLSDLLAERSWSVLIPYGKDDFFICSDNPVGLESPAMEMGDTPLFTDRQSILTFPLNRRLALIGRFDEEPFTAEVGREMIARMNMQTLRRATRCLYAPKNTAIGMQKDGSVGYLQDILSLIK